MNMQRIPRSAPGETGAIRRFGTTGPAYCVQRKLSDLADGDSLMEIALVETGEIAQHRLSLILADPVAQ